MSNESPDNALEGVAIIGMVGRFANARNIDEFWQNLCDGVESIKFFTPEELAKSGISPARLANPNFVAAAANVEDIDHLDASFFGYNPVEAEAIDPQQRIFLECAWEVLEGAAYNTDTYDGRIGVYAGTGRNWYKNHLSGHIDEFSAAIGNLSDYLTTRVAYKLNLKGPSVTVQTACSTSLVATSLACQSLLNYQTDMALAGGVCLSILKGYEYEEGSIHSADGHCRTFDAKAKGTLFASGVGVVLLKRLSEAVADGDQIYAVIKGYGVNNDGISKIGYTAPGVDGQAEAIAEAMAMAGVNPETVRYVEAHGTATTLGDPIEITALTKAYRASTQKTGFCAVGSVKTNIGHTDAAAGVAGLMKTALCVKHGKIPASLNFEEPNPKIDFANSPFYVNTRLTEWKPEETPRRAGVSSFGIGGTNAHVILEEAPPVEESGPSRPAQLLLLSAKTETALDKMTSNLAEYLKKNADAKLSDVAYTLQVGRKGFNYRRMVVARSAEEAVNAFERQDERVVTAEQENTYRPVVFMFPGQGAQHVGMASELYGQEKTFREHVDNCSEIIKPLLGFDLRDVLYPSAEKAEEAANTLGQTSVTQPALFVVEYALAKLWMEWGVRPEAMVGHSIGEYVAACLSGVLSLEDALRLVVQRGRVMQGLPAGSMLSVSAPEDEIRPLLGERLSIAAVNAPSLCAVSGETDAVEELERRLTEAGVFFRRLHTSHAFHSEMMEPALAPFTAEVRKVRLSAPTIPYLSNVTGTWITEAEATDPSYYAKHLRQAVRFSDNVVELLKDESRVFVEVGPGQTSQVLVKQHPDTAEGRVVVSSLRKPQEEQSDAELILGGLGRLWLAGVQIDWRQFYAGERRRRVSLPTYPFERQRYWVARSKAEAKEREAAAPAGKRPDISDWFYMPTWKQTTPAAFLARNESAQQPSRWLVFLDECGLGSRLAERLRREGNVVTGVRADEELARLDDETFALNPSKPEDYTALLKQLAEEERTPNHIAHLWSVTPAGGERPSVESFETAQDNGFYSLLYLAQALGARTSKDPVRIGVVSSNVQDVTGGEGRAFEKATLLGAAKVIPQEYPEIECRSIDVEVGDSAARLDQLSEYLVSELTADSPDAVVAYRGSQRWAQAPEPVRVGGDPGARAVALREGGVYLITGGMGGIGLSLAEYLAREAKAKLVLITRSAFPAREEWSRYLEANGGDGDDVGGRILQMLALEELGAEVMVCSADVTDLGQMRGVVEQAREQFGAVHGVIHSAGVPGGGLIQLKTREVVSGVFSPKVKGAFVLDSLFDGEKLDFFFVFSSLAATLGGVGQVDYCAANIFLDAFAQSRAVRDDALTVSVGWDAWAEVGMAVKARKNMPKTQAPAPSQEKAKPAAAANGSGNGNGNGNGHAGIHPLLDRCVFEGDERTFVTEFTPSKQWVLGDHKIQGYPTLVGTSYLEMARAAFATLDLGSAVEIKDVIFMGPMVVDEGETKEMHLVLRKSGGEFEFIAKSKQPSAGGEAQFQEHVRGRIAPAQPETPKVHAAEDWHVESSALDTEARKKLIPFTAPEGPAAQTVQATGRGSVVLGPRWKGVKEYRIGTDTALATFELPEEFSADLEEFKLHPAMMDAATSFALGLVEKSALYLPFSYGRVKITGPLSRTIRSFARLRPDSSIDSGVVSFDIVMTNEDGLELVEVEGFTMKKVGGVKIRERGGNAAGEGAAAAQKAASAADAEAILPAEGVEVFRRILSKDVPPELIVSTGNLQRRIKHAKASTSAAVVERMDKKLQKGKASHPRPNLKTPYVAPENDLERDIAEVWQAVLGIDGIGVNDNFLELGGHSLIAIQIVHRLRDAYKINLPMDSVFKSLTVSNLAPLVLATLAEQADEELLAKLLDDIEQIPG